VAVAALVGSASANCFQNCNTTYIGCEYNQYVDKEICAQGMESCVVKCFNNLASGNESVWAKNCTKAVEYLDFVDNSTAHRVMTQCMWQAFKPKISWDWSAYECNNQCNDTSARLCNWQYSQWINYYECRNATDSCYYDCFGRDFNQSDSCNNGRDRNGQCCSYYGLTPWGICVNEYCP
jgi:hypothetical protein